MSECCESYLGYIFNEETDNYEECKNCANHRKAITGEYKDYRKADVTEIRLKRKELDQKEEVL